MRRSIQLHEEWHLESMLANAAKAGFTEVAIGFSESDVCYRDDYENEAERLCELLRKHHLVCRQIHLPCYPLLESSELVKEDVEKAIKRGIHVGALLGAEWGAFHPRTAVTQGYDRAVSFCHNREKLSEYLEYAEKYGMGIAVENMPLYPYTAPHFRFFGAGWEDLCELVDTFDSDKIGICWDFGHAHLAALDQSVALKTIGKRLKITHVHDNTKNDDHHQLPLLGNSDWNIRWEPIMKTLCEIGYQGALTLEVVTPPISVCEGFVKCGYDGVSYLWELYNKEKV